MNLYEIECIIRQSVRNEAHRFKLFKYNYPSLHFPNSFHSFFLHELKNKYYAN